MPKKTAKTAGKKIPATRANPAGKKRAKRTASKPFVKKAATKPKGVPGPVPRFKEEYIDVVEEMTADGKTIEEIARFLNIDQRTLYRWAEKYEGISHALKKGRLWQAEKVVQSLFKRAIGYDYEEVKRTGTIKGDGDGGDPSLVGGKVERTVKHVPADLGSAAFLLKNLLPEKYRDKWDIETKGDLNITYCDMAVLDEIEGRGDDGQADGEAA